MAADLLPDYEELWSAPSLTLRSLAPVPAPGAYRGRRIVSVSDALLPRLDVRQTLRVPESVLERLVMVAEHYGVAPHALMVGILCEWANEHVPYRAARAGNGAWWDRRMRAPEETR
jgi:hypothetical protein